MSEEFSYESALTRNTDFTSQLGLAVVEFNQLEVMLSRTLGRILDLHFKVVDALYFTPKSNTGRIDILKNVAAVSLTGADLKSISRLCAKAMALAGRRHEIVHSLWVSFEEGDVSRIKLPSHTRNEVKIQELSAFIRDVQNLILELMEHNDKWTPPKQRSRLP